jgi:hypothetical protein
MFAVSDFDFFGGLTIAGVSTLGLLYWAYVERKAQS